MLPRVAPLRGGRAAPCTPGGSRSSPSRFKGSAPMSGSGADRARNAPQGACATSRGRAQPACRSGTWERAQRAVACVIQARVPRRLRPSCSQEESRGAERLESLLPLGGAARLCAMHGIEVDPLHHAGPAPWSGCRASVEELLPRARHRPPWAPCRRCFPTRGAAPQPSSTFSLGPRRSHDAGVPRRA